MLAYKLRYKIEVFKTEKTKDLIGAFTENDVLVESVFADVNTGMGRTIQDGDKVIYTNETTFVIRNYPIINYTNWIKYNGDKYKIIGIQPLQDGSGQILKTVLMQ